MNSIWTVSPGPDIVAGVAPSSPSVDHLDAGCRGATRARGGGSRTRARPPRPTRRCGGGSVRRRSASSSAICAGRPAQRLGVDQGGVGRPVAVVAAGGPLEMDRRQGPRRSPMDDSAPLTATAIAGRAAMVRRGWRAEGRGRNCQATAEHQPKIGREPASGRRRVEPDGPIAGRGTRSGRAGRPRRAGLQFRGPRAVVIALAPAATHEPS